MSPVKNDQLYHTIQSLKESALAALSRQSAEEFEHFERRLNQFDTRLRELQQALWATEAKDTIARLDKGQPLSEVDGEVIRAFLISDAERYLSLENNFDDWRQELDRLMNEIERDTATVDRASIDDLRGKLKDAIRLVPDIRNYLTEQRRIDKFEVAMKNLDAPSRRMLADLMKEQLRAADR